MSEQTLYIYTCALDQRKKVPLKDNDGVSVAAIIKSLERDCDVSHLHNYGLLLRNTQKTRDAFNTIATAYGKQIPDVFKLKALPNHLREGEEFYLVFADKATDIERKIAVDSLNCMNGNVIPIVAYNKIFEFYIHQSFDFVFYSFGFDGLPVSVGESKKELRKCRFCGATGKDKFGDEAHAIQDSLGNKLLICYEECDDCNHTLNSIEDNFLRLMDVRRALYQIPRKSSSACPHIIGKNYVIKPDALGKPEVFIMKDEIASGTDSSKPFVYKMIHKQSVTNENILKALSKMVIDLIPSQYLSELQNTIKWLKTLDGTWAVDDLPSYLVAVLPKEMFFKQPVLDLFIRKNDDGKTPFCTAILWIYDIAYMFVLPLVDADSGRFKNDASLQFHWKKMINWYKLPWTIQNTSDWQEAKVWVYANIDPTNPSYHILPMSDSVFDDSRKRKIVPPSEKFPPVDINDINVCKVKAKFKNYYKGPKLSDSDLIDLTQHITPLRYILDTKHSRVTITMVVDVNNQKDTELWFSYDLKVTFSIRRFGRNIRIRFSKDGSLQSFAIDDNLCKALYKRMLMVCESQLSIKRKGTNFESADITRMGDQMERFLEASTYHIPMKGGEWVIPDNLVHGRVYEE